MLVPAAGARVAYPGGWHLRFFKPGENVMNIKAWIAVAALSLGSVGCATYEGMSSSEKGALIGAGVGAVGGAAVSDGGVLGTAAGAAAGGLIGNEIGKRR
jgi:osmotically inducible lipoprotein OsmB